MQTLMDKMVQDVITGVKNLLILEPEGQKRIKGACFVGVAEVMDIGRESA